MTGEITLRGRVLPIGGLKEKIMAAHRAGSTTVILPNKNKNDLIEVPKDVQRGVQFVFVDDMSQVLPVALADKIAGETLAARVVADGKQEEDSVADEATPALPAVVAQPAHGG